MLDFVTTQLLFHFFLIFSRLGTALVLMPGFGEVYVSPKARLALALGASAVLTPVLEPVLPVVPEKVLPLFMVLCIEIMIGAFIGGLARMIQSTLHVAGMIIAFQSSLASALLFDANQGSQGSVIGNFMTLVGVALLFATGLHHIMLIGIAESYSTFEAGAVPYMGDFAQMASQTLSGGFAVAFKMSAPLTVVGLLVYLASGIMARLMPNMQVFFVVIPAQILVSFMLIMITLSASMMWYLKYFQNRLDLLFVH